jgi:uncharacterized protein YndB with AHSA1/START domain
MFVVKDVSPSTDTIRVEGEFAAFSPAELFDYFVKPDLVVQWWPREATVDPREGGEYKFSWPEQGWHLQGRYTRFEPGARLGFTWSWDHDQTKYEPQQVELAFEQIEGGTKLTIDHGPWTQDGSEQTDRQGVIEGWIHFGMRLAGLRTGEAT